ncbi:hypothetical protein HHL22_22720 [Hymenobacter sp. RP-2-7]|uniref:STAS/SEC14 domain-containing protein n=1 Tax=Hymenobacter polaris TaxID=2682546 RepID=A0A7Y0AII8_9BACT|nr:hypothetical protein [Hymenobacter polaris]NML68021.1 hypothetical protein [Hymenobacter polaris]
MKTLFTAPYLTIYLHDSPAPMLELSWQSYAGSADFRAAAQQALALTQQFQVKAWLGDDRLLGAVRPADLQWAEHDILPALAQAGLQRFALLAPVAPMNNLLLGDMYKRTIPQLPYEIRYFTDLTEARTWALEMSNPT